MITITNPIYDTVFKYLLEDLDIAKGLISTIINREIVEISVQPQETISEIQTDDKTLRVFRIDFAAVIKEDDGSLKKILIELQKSKRSTNIVRFRRYLAESYQREETVIVNDKEEKIALELVAIYFLGFDLDKDLPSILQVKNTFIDVRTGLELPQTPRDQFVRLLNHESYMIQLGKLEKTLNSRLEDVLDVFNQTYKMLGDDKRLQLNKESDDPLVQKILYRLTRAIADDELRRKLNLEEETQRDYDSVMAEIEKNRKELAEKDAMLEEQRLLIAELMKKINP